MMNLTPFGELFKNSWELYKRRFAILSNLMILPFFFSVISAVFQNRSAISNFSQFAQHPTSKLTLLLAFAAYLVVIMWIQISVLYAVDSPEDKPVLSELLSKGLKLLAPMIWVGILTGLAVAGGLVLFIIPGIIFALWFVFSGQTVVFENQRGVNALKASKQLVKDRLGAVFGRLILAALLLGIISSIVGGITGALGLALALSNSLLGVILTASVAQAFSSFVVTPLGIVFTYLLYKDLRSKQTTEATPVTPMPTSVAPTPPTNPIA